MKHRKLFTLLAAAVLGISAAPMEAGFTAITAKAEVGWTSCREWPWEYGYDNGSDEAYILKYLGYSANVTVPDTLGGKTVTEIANIAFRGNRAIRHVTVSNTVTRLSDSAFANSSLQTITIPDSVDYIDWCVFENSGLQSIVLPASVQTIRWRAFYNCRQLTSVTIQGAAVLGEEAFANCTALTNVTLSSASTTEAAKTAFQNCPNLVNLNGASAYTMQPDANGISCPVLRQNVRELVRKHFSRGIGIGFVDNFCDAYCKYVVDTETDSWMNEALKARQLYDWLIRHCEYEDFENGELFNDLENHVPSSVFLSAALDTRGTGVGESVCVGYAKAYCMLLSKAEMQSYLLTGCNCIGKGGRAWNAVKIGDRYYECDALADDPAGQSVGDYGTSYQYFLKNDTDMVALHNSRYGYTNMYDCHTEHTLLAGTEDYIVDKLEQCPQSYQDDNHDGILDLDFDLDGEWLMNDTEDDQSACNGMLYFLYGNELNMFQINDKLPEVLYWLHAYHKDYWDFVNTSAPTAQTAAYGENAEFTVTLFGDLVYRWYCRAAGSNQWIPASDYNGSSSPVLEVPANSSTNQMLFQCVVFNTNGYYIYSNPVALTVS